MNTTLVREEALAEIEEIKKAMSEDELVAAETAIEVIKIFMAQRYQSYESYISRALMYINKKFFDFGEKGLLLVASYFYQDGNFLQAMVASKKVVQMDKIILLAKIGFFAEGVCEKILENYDQEKITDKLIEEMKRLVIDGQLRVVTRAVQMPYVSDKMAYRISKPFINYQEVSAAMLKRTLDSLQAIPSGESRDMYQI